ncbi:RHS repeat-associated core domain-containing protein [Streptomyces sp. R44]|uniref:RHS repeat-associated core domain-containing protein n=1 Tax=Streptomyces sp. R44 TaxID=3238633 RepID=A0AB39T2Z6_9ACTN
MTDHDPAGDTTKNTRYDYAYNATQPHTLTAVASTPSGNGSTYAYNSTGTTRTRDLPGGPSPDQTLQWTPEDNLESNTVTYDDGTNTLKSSKTTYVYDAYGNRILENSPTGSTLYLGETELTTNGTNVTQASRSYSHAGAPTVVRATANGATSNHTITVLIADHLGTANTTVQVTAGQPVARRSFKPYGELRGPKPATWPNKRGYLGVGIDDTTSGLTHIGAREYDQNTGRFISADPLVDITDPLQMNGYTYSNASPVSKVDPTGEAFEECVNGMYRCSGGTQVIEKGSNYGEIVQRNIESQRQQGFNRASAGRGGNVTINRPTRPILPPRITPRITPRLPGILGIISIIASQEDLKISYRKMAKRPAGLTEEQWDDSVGH